MAGTPKGPIIKAEEMTRSTIKLRRKRNGSGSRKITKARFAIAQSRKGEEDKTSWREHKAAIRANTWRDLRPGSKYI
jgi:hypothetical protein